MKTRNQIAAYMGLLGMTTLIAILISIRDRLVAIGPWVLDVLLAVIGLVIAYLLHKLYVSFRKDRLELQARIYEVEGHKQTLRLESEKWEIERSSILLSQHLQTARIYPDTKGFLPTLVNIQEDGSRQYINLPHPAHMGRISGRDTQQAIPEHASSLDHAIPTSIRYEQVAAQIPRGHGLLGVSATSVETDEFENFMTMLISGGSNSGKSNTVGLKIDEAIRNGRDIHLVVIDWHARKKDSLYNKIRGYESRFLMPVVTEEEDTLPALQWFYTEFKRRRSEGSEGVSDILLVIDEVPGMMDSEIKEIPEMLKRIARMAGREGRGFGVYAWFICQQMIGMAWLRNVVHTVIAHKATRMNEAEIACNDHRDIARDMENWPQGRVIVYGQNFSGVKVLQMPIFTPPVVDADRGSGAVYIEMEELQPQGFSQSFPSAPYTPRERNLQQDSNFQTGPLQRDFESQKETDGKVLVFQKNASNRPGDGSDLQTDEGLKYRFTETEIVQFIAAYKVAGNIETVLKSMRKGSGYKPHAREIIALYGLRQNA